MTTQQRITKDDWYTVCLALQVYAEKLADWSRLDGASDAMRQSFASQNEQARELLTRLVNTKLSDRDKYGFFSEFVDW